MWGTRKKAVWAAHPLLHLCFSITHLHFLMVEFLESVQYDHSILLDFIVSPETVQFDELLADYLELCSADWTALSSACEELDVSQSMSVA